MLNALLRSNLRCRLQRPNYLGIIRQEAHQWAEICKKKLTKWREKKRETFFGSKKKKKEYLPAQ